tara:strand:- start:343 stop:1452 length:1110 start_codon:yes stop_codon:yes gene_type:complete
MAGMSFEEYVQAYYGGTLGIAKRYGIQKADDTFETSDPAGAFNTMYGAAVFNQLNTKSEVFKLLKKEAWTQSGWRVLTGRHATTAGLAEGAAFPDTDKPDITEVTATLKEVVSPWEVTTRAELLSEADDGIKGILNFLRTEAAEAHTFFMDQMLLATADTAAGNNMESLDRVTMSDAAANATLSARADIDMYDIDRSANSWADATVSHNSGSDRALTLAMLDTVIQGALENGVNYSDLILLTGYDTYQDLKALMLSTTNNTFRADLSAAGAANANGVVGEAGLNFDSRVGAYDGIPIFLSQHVVKDTTSRIHLLDMGNLAVRVAAPTTYVDNTNLAVLQKLSKEFAFVTAGELICYRFNTSGSVRDLNA